MTPPSDVDLKGLALELVGEFSIAQESVDLLVVRYFEARTPGMMRYLNQKRVTTNIPDQERPRLVQELASELGTSADLAKFKTVFDRVKRVRDYAGHTARIEVVDPDTLHFTKQFITRPEQKENPPLTITRSQLLDRLHDARWLAQCVHYILAKSDLITTISFRGQEITYVKPPPNPEDWDGLQFEPVATWSAS